MDTSPHNKVVGLLFFSSCPQNSDNILQEIKAPFCHTMKLQQNKEQMAANSHISQADLPQICQFLHALFGKCDYFVCSKAVAMKALLRPKPYPFSSTLWFKTIKQCKRLLYAQSLMSLSEEITFYLKISLQFTFLENFKH